MPVTGVTTYLLRMLAVKGIFSVDNGIGYITQGNFLTKSEYSHHFKSLLRYILI